MKDYGGNTVNFMSFFFVCVCTPPSVGPTPSGNITASSYFFCLFVFLSLLVFFLHLSVHLSTNLSVCPFIFSTVSLSVNLLVSATLPSVCPSIHALVCLSFRLPVRLFLRPSTRSVSSPFHLEEYRHETERQRSTSTGQPKERSTIGAGPQHSGQGCMVFVH